jgi:hypothetical protein
MAACARAVSTRAGARPSGLGIAAVALVACHLVSTGALVSVMLELRRSQAEEGRTSELMRALAISICGRLPSRLPMNRPRAFGQSSSPP